RRDQETQKDDDQIRLESDSNLVKISTIHNSKGLSYPVVFSPFLWSSNQFDKKVPLLYHETEKNGYRSVVDFTFFDSEQKRRALRQSLLEETAEDVRKSYVAVTRARYANYVYWGVTQESCYSGLGAILAGRDKLQVYFGGLQNLKTGEGDLSPSFYQQILEELAGKHPGLFQISTLNDYETAEIIPVESGIKKFNAKTYSSNQNLTPGKRLFSFSSLLFAESEAAYKPDYDEWTTDIYHKEPTDSYQNPTLFNFPKGAAAGTVIHHIFESQAFGDIDKNRLKETIESLLIQNRFDLKWKNSLLQMVEDVNTAKLKATVDEVVHLMKLGEDDQLAEMEFQLKSREPEDRAVLNCIRGEKSSGKVSNEDVKTFMKGFIDLIVWQNNKAYIIDYKSNYLGDSFEDYNDKNLASEIRDKMYDIQYHFYTLALSKYLEKKISDYHYDVHFGGVFYLFVRGIRPGADTGIFFHKPGRKIIKELEEWLLT
ncbi:MAG: 3'-5' exonuclease, partial [Balneolaceae bacterium]